MHDPFKEDSLPVYFNVTEYEKFIGTVSDSTLPFTQFWCSIKEYPQFSGKGC